MDFKQKFTEVKQKVVDTSHKVMKKTLDVAAKVTDWVSKNPQAAVAAVYGTYKVVRKGHSMYSNYQLEHKHDREIYDESLHIWHPIKRQLTYQEELAFKQAVHRGEDGVEVLKEMRVYRG